MEAAVWAALDALVPEARQQGLVVRCLDDGRLELSGRLDIRLATLVNVALAKLRLGQGPGQGAAALFDRVCRKKLQLFVPRVRLGDVTNEFDREVLEEQTKNEAYLDPDSLIELPEWNSDFVLASDRRHQFHIRPRYSQDDDATIDAVAAFVAEHCRQGQGIVVHTGAGISAAAGIATYREGSSESIAMSAALPTYSHYALVALTRLGFVDYLCSQNVDGLHRRSGLAANRLSELHGNSYIEACSCCSPPMEFVRPYDAYSTRSANPKYWAKYVKRSDGSRGIEANVELTTNERSSGIHHITGRACPRGGGPLRDSVIHFGENLPQFALAEGERRSRAAPLNLVVGSSLLVRPASGLPFEGAGPTAIVSMTCTGEDMKALKRGGVLLRASADVAFERIMHHLGLAHFSHVPRLMDALHQRVRLRDEAVLGSDGDIPYDGGADGGVVPDSLVSPPTPTPQPAPVAPSGGASSAVAGIADGLSALQLRQTHKALDEGQHRWSLALESADRGASLNQVKSVQFELHPTFQPSTYELRAPPFQVGPFVGWGTFDVKVIVDMGSDLPAVTTRFPLSFRRPEKTLPLVSSAA